MTRHIIGALLGFIAFAYVAFVAWALGSDFERGSFGMFMLVIYGPCMAGLAYYAWLGSRT